MVVANAGSSLHDGDRVGPILADAVRTELLNGPPRRAR